VSGAGEVHTGRLLETLGRVLPGDRIVADPDVLAAISHDDAELAPGVLTEDVCVPRSKAPAMLARIEAIAARHGVQISTIAHAGDGNLHPLIVTRRATMPPGPPRVTGRLPWPRP
jgi:FAD/FMN-containing dehydrogenase